MPENTDPTARCTVTCPNACFRIDYVAGPDGGLTFKEEVVTAREFLNRVGVPPVLNTGCPNCGEGVRALWAEEGADG